MIRTRWPADASVRSPLRLIAARTGLALAILLASVALSALADPAGLALTSTAPAVVWLPSLAEGYKQAQRMQQPVLAYVGAEWCGPCRLLKAEIAKPAVQSKLGEWTCVYIDADKDAPDADALGASALPALRVLTPSGTILASDEGYRDAEDLIVWLDAHAKDAQVAAGAELAGSGEPDTAALEKLIALLRRGQGPVAEAATRRLIGYPAIAAPRIVEVFVSGKLSDRLASMELLTAWNAPLDGVDPWKPQTLTAEKAAALKQWALHVPATTEPAKPTTQSLKDAGEEIDRMLAATTDAEAAVIRARLARLGPDLLPEVRDRLNHSATDRDHERLTALRYRLVSSEKLVLTWPGGLERLASLDVQRRHQAMDEFEKLASAEDGPLLLELFADPDPLIRETSLRILQSAGGDVEQGLLKLLHDPEPNVRAAVLKQMAEAPKPWVSATVIGYIATEKDPDLIVHAVRVLREAKDAGPEVIQCLTGLLDHPNWRIRAEAADAMHELDPRSVLPEAIVTKVLADPDGFVAGRGIAMIDSTSSPDLVKPLFTAVGLHPELTRDALKAIDGAPPLQAAALPYLRELCKNTDASVRAAAIKGICQVGNEDHSANLLAAFGDPAQDVRIAAANGMLQLLEAQRPDGNGAADPQAGMLDWFDTFVMQGQRPGWMAQMTTPLMKMLAAPAVEERCAAAIPLIALGKADAAYGPLHAAIDSTPDLQGTATDALPWLPMGRRLELFKYLTASARDRRVRSDAIEKMAIIPDVRAGTALWELSATTDFDPELSQTLLEAVCKIYVNNSYNLERETPRKIMLLTRAATQNVQSGTETHRRIALVLLQKVNPQAATTQAAAMADDSATPPGLRLDALRVQLLSLEKLEAQKKAVDLLSSNDADARHMAIDFLCGDTREIQETTDHLYLSYSDVDQLSYVNTAVQYPPPAGLTVEAAAALLKDPEPQVRARAGYLLAPLNDSRGLDDLITYWRSQTRDREELDSLVYRAIASANDQDRVPILAEIYQKMNKDQWRVRQLYWTIRPMTGPAVLKLRKQIRDEVGMDNLR